MPWQQLALLACVWRHMKFWIWMNIKTSWDLLLYFSSTLHAPQIILVNIPKLRKMPKSNFFQYMTTLNPEYFAEFLYGNIVSLSFYFWCKVIHLKLQFGTSAGSLAELITWIPWNLPIRYIHCTGQFTPKMKANAESRLLSSLVWIDSGIVVSQRRLESFFMK